MDNIEFLLQSLDSQVEETNETEKDSPVANEILPEEFSDDDVATDVQPKSSVLEDDKKNASKKYSEYGYSIHKRLKEIVERKSASDSLANKSSWKVNTSTANIKRDQLSAPSQIQVNKDVYAEPIFGLRLINPVVSSQFIQTKMVGRQPVTLAKLQNHLTVGDKNTDWVIAGAIVFKSGLKTSQKGSQYCLWKISDLKYDLKQVSVYLFGKASSELWKISLGTVVAVLNASPLNKDEKTEAEDITLSVRNSDQIMVWGSSRDYGICKAKKKNGDDCTSFVNKTQCEFCVYHVRSEYNKFSGKRHELQSPSNGLTALRNKVLGKNEVFYGGKSFTALKPPPSNNKLKQKDRNTLSNLSMNPKQMEVSQNNAKLLESDAQRLEILSAAGSSVPKKNTVSRPPPVTKDEKSYSNRLDLFKDAGQKMISTGELTRVSAARTDKKNTFISFATVFSSKPEEPARGGNDVNLRKRKLDAEEKESLSRLPNSTKKNQSELFVQNTKKIKPNNDILKPKSVPNNETTGKETQNKNIKTMGPQLDDFELEIIGCEDDNNNKSANRRDLMPKMSPFLNKTSSELANSFHKRKRELAKKSAIQLIKQKGGITKTNPNKIRPDKKSALSVNVAKSNTDEDALSPQQDPAKKSVLSERFIQLMNAQSKHEHLVQLAADVEEQNYFNKMEKKEQLEEKMLTTYKIPCKAVYCVQCKYKWFSASELCKTERHPVKVVDAVKRFFKCDNCTNRTVSLEIVPLTSCKNCGAAKWSRAPMMKEKTVHLNGNLSIRGDEVKFLDAMEQRPSLNLLVPE